MAEKPYFHCGLQTEKSKLLGTTLLNEIVVIKTMIIIVIIAILVVIIKIILVTMITVMQSEQSKRRSLDR